MKIIISMLIPLILFSSFASAECDPKELVVKFSFVTALKGHPKGEAASAIAKRINTEMNGKMCMLLFPKSTLFNDNKVMEGLLLGDAHMAAPSMSRFEPYTKKYRVFDLPFLFRDIAAVKKFTQGAAGQKLLQAIEDKGYVGLGYIYNGLKNISANKPLVLPSDASGMVFRVTSDVTSAAIAELGSQAKKLPFKEVYNALRNGAFDGQDNTWSNIYSQRFYEVQDGITETNHMFLTYMAVTSKPWLDSLPAEIRGEFLQIVKEEIILANDRSAQLNVTARNNIVSDGGVVRVLTPEQRQEWVQVMKPVWERFRRDIGDDVIAAAVAAGEK